MGAITRMWKHVVCCLMLAGVLGCAHTGPPSAKSTAVPAQADSVELSRILVRDMLIQHYSEWQGTPYRVGGLSKSGIDCSGFVQETFRTRLGIELPRTTRQQVRVGEPVSEETRQAGDLVFFKTGISKRHVGIYLGESEFLHASSSRGVTLSRMDHPYWKSNYWQSRRIAD